MAGKEPQRNASSEPRYNVLLEINWVAGQYREFAGEKVP